MPDPIPAEEAVHPRDLPSAWVDAVYPATLAHGIPWHDDAIRVMLAAALPSIDRYIRDAVAEDEQERIRADERRKVAEEIARRIETATPFHWTRSQARSWAARIARQIGEGRDSS